MTPFSRAPCGTAAPRLWSRPVIEEGEKARLLERVRPPGSSTSAALDPSGCLLSQPSGCLRTAALPRCVASHRLRGTPLRSRILFRWRVTSRVCPDEVANGTVIRRSGGYSCDGRMHRESGLTDGRSGASCRLGEQSDDARTRCSPRPQCVCEGQYEFSIGQFPPGTIKRLPTPLSRRRRGGEGVFLRAPTLDLGTDIFPPK